MYTEMGPISGSRYIARLRATGADWGMDIRKYYNDGWQM